MTADIRTRVSGDSRLIFEKSKSGKEGLFLPSKKFPDRNFGRLIPPELKRESICEFPELTEPELIRHFVNLSKKNFSVDTHFYPLGSCTMKYNPKIHEDVASLDGFAWVNPSQTEDQIQGTLQIFYELGRSLCELTGMHEFTLQPAAGAHGELCGMMLTRAYHASRGETKRHLVLVPDSSHGTNPASAAQYGYQVVQIPSDEKGRVDLQALEETMSDQV